MKLGAHIGISGGLARAPPRAVELGCEVMQIFTKNQMQWRVPALKPDDAQGFRDGVREAKLGPTLVHASYLLNLASPDDALWQKSVDGLTVELERAEALEIPFVTFHPGSPKDKGASYGVKRVAEGVSQALLRTRGMRVMVLLETNAGQGNAVGRTFQELGDMMAAVSEEKARLGVCLDTCHVFVSGYPLHTEEGYADTFDTFDNEVGLKHLHCFHLNDSKAEFDSKRDRHADIGEGHLGLETFSRLVNDARFVDHPAYLETPAAEDGYAAQLQTLRGLVGA